MIGVWETGVGIDDDLESKVHEMMRKTQFPSRVLCHWKTRTEVLVLQVGS
jgi:hypothetical protein